MKGHQMALTELQTSNGWILLHRSLLDSKEFSASPAQFKVLIYLILSANHKARFVRSVEIKRGQCVRSLTRISDDCDLSRKAVRCALSNLAKSGFVNISTPFGAHQGHMITICNYDLYQSQRQSTGIEGINEGNNEGTNEGNNEGTTNKNDKNGKERKERKEGTPALNERSTGAEHVLSEISASGQVQDTSGHATSDRAASIYAAYPKKVGRAAAIKAIKAAIKAGVDPARLLERTEAYAAAVKQWPASEQQYIPHPATWYNHGRWDDDPAAWVKTAKVETESAAQQARNAHLKITKGAAAAWM